MWYFILFILGLAIGAAGMFFLLKKKIINAGCCTESK
jgi:hypothetical protein